ncbi:C1QL4-like protein [Mya arenaria]|uniref:C1QL4-like protein n=1 Tax=Mya arenaria TaxID=6604 RepID=A0ABY7ESR1_MYAAR|nr:complement C1q-like protein 4 [Mya arenaria]WAR11851.1 C1QL4-like protein [Mya arenaria]
MLMYLTLVCVALAAGACARNVNEWDIQPKLTGEEFSVLQEELNVLKELIETQGQEINELKTIGLTGLQLGPIAFSAKLDRTVSQIGIGQKLIFNDVMTNVGNAYNVHAGVFTCPRAGLYLFSYFIGKGRTGQAWFRLMKNGIVINGAVADSVSRFHDTQGGNVAVLHLKIRDSVYVESFHQNSAQVSGDNGFVTFSGFLL